MKLPNIAVKAIAFLWAAWLNAYDVFFQKLSMWHLGSLDTVGSSAKALKIIITGPTSGIGLETARELARRGAHVVLACRSIERGEKLQQELLAVAAESGSTSTKWSPKQVPAAQPVVEVWPLDLSVLSSVRSFAERWEREQRPLHVLINNAGIFSMSAPRVGTIDGFEGHMSANHLGHYLLTLMLVPALRRGAQQCPDFGARIVSVSSTMHHFASAGILLADPHLAHSGAFSSNFAYGQSKLAQILFTRELRRRLPRSDNIHAFALHPGCVLTDVVRSLPATIRAAYRIVMKTLLLTPKEGARATMYCATSPAAPAEAVSTGGYFNSNCRPAQPSSIAQDPAQAAWLWQWSADAVKLPKQFNLPAP